MSTHTPYTSKLYTSEEIRLVRVAAGRWHEPIRCTLFCHGLDEALKPPPYRALSYVWGSSLVTDTIALQDLPFQVTLNLSCALRHLRRVDSEILLWVDALCINQKDHKERGLQVSIMKLIYNNAAEVVVFMGDGRGHRVNRSHLKEPRGSPMTTLHGHERRKHLFTDVWSAYQSSGSRKLVSSLSAATCVMGMLSLFTDQETVEEGCMELMKLGKQDRCDLFEHFRAFVTCPWWSRIWVVQEIAVSTAVTIHYGTITLSWEDLIETANVWSLPKTRQVASSLGIEPENLKVFVLFANQLTGLEQTRRKWHAEDGTDLVRLLQEFSDRQATDDRDKVYGLLSLAKDDQQNIEPNYELDVFGTYRATALTLIANGGAPACWAGDQKRKLNRGLPSWIPDWSTAIDIGDKLRMDLFESYSANCGWTLRVIEDEMEYWTTVEREMALLIQSSAGRRLPESLNHFVLDYIELLTQRSKSLTSKVDAVRLEELSMERLNWDSLQGINPELTLNSLEWCEKFNVTPRTGKGLLRRWIRELRKMKRLGETPVEQAGEQEAEPSGGRFEKIGRHLRQLDAAVVGERYLDLEDWMRGAKFALHGIESTMLGTTVGMVFSEGTVLGMAIESFIDQCQRLSSLCSEFEHHTYLKIQTAQHLPNWGLSTSHSSSVDSSLGATDHAISPSKLFKSSYSLRGTASWLTEYQSAQANPQKWGTGLSPCEDLKTPDRMLAMQMVFVDFVIHCGPRQFGWADTKSALTTLVSWLYLLDPVVAETMTDQGEMELNHTRIRHFAKTIVGGMCRRGGSYQEADDTALGPLEDWLRQCLVVPTGWRGGEPSDPETGRDAIRGADPVVLRERWLRSLSEASGLVVPPSPFFEDIQVATDGRVFFLTQNGSMGLGPASMRPGDSIRILPSPSGGAHFVLRSKPSGMALPYADFPWWNQAMASDTEPKLELLGLSPWQLDIPDWIEALKSDPHELIGDCYLHADRVLDERIPIEKQPVVKGSLPYELLGARYFRERGLPMREAVILV